MQYLLHVYALLVFRMEYFCVEYLILKKKLSIVLKMNEKLLFILKVFCNIIKTQDLILAQQFRLNTILQLDLH